MRKFRIGFICFLATLLVAFVAGCGQETVTLPSVVSVTPAQGSVNVAVSTTITATFSQAMSAASISATTFTVAAPGGTAVAGTVSYSGGVATFTPGAALAFGTTYTATITTGAQDLAGTPLDPEAGFDWRLVLVRRWARQRVQACGRIGRNIVHRRRHQGRDRWKAGGGRSRTSACCGLGLVGTFGRRFFAP